MYTFETDNHLALFLLSAGAGFLLGVLYDVIRTIRLVVSEKKAAAVVADCIYAVVASVLTYIFLLAVNKGAVRGYILVAEALGWVLWYISLGAVFMRLSAAAARLIRRAVLRTAHIIALPFLRFFGFFKAIREKISLSLRKKEKKSKKNLKKLLQSAKVTLYNLSSLLSRTNKNESGE